MVSLFLEINWKKDFLSFLGDKLEEGVLFLEISWDRINGLFIRFLPVKRLGKK